MENNPHQVFAMPMYRDFVPHFLRPWLYLVVAFLFQMSNSVYLAALNQLEGERCLMREDLLMTLYMNMLGLALAFPILFSTKFRFTNKQLLCFAAIGIIVENLIILNTTCLPLMWAAAFLGGFCKLQGTFECMSNVQLWMTPERDFRVFFPMLHLIIFGSICVSSIATAALTYSMDWQMIHWFMIGAMLLCLIFFSTCLRSFHHIPNVRPIAGTDFLGCFLLAAFFSQLIYVLTYGDWAGWLDSPTIRILLVTSAFTLFVLLWRNFRIERPYIELKMWTYPHVIPILLISIVFEVLLTSERVLEEIYLEDVMHYAMLPREYRLNVIGIIGVVSGCLFSYIWLYRLRYRLLPLFAIGTGFIIAYFAWMYFYISPNVCMEQLYPSVFCRQFASASLSICFLTTLQSLVGFLHFFQCLGIFQTLHLCFGSTIGGALYGETFRRYMSINMARYGEAISREHFSSAPFDLNQFISTTFLPDVMAISLKTIYGWGLYAAIFLLLFILIYDAGLKHRRLQRNLWIPSWKNVSNLLHKISSKSSATAE